MTWAMLVPRKGTGFQWIAKRAASFIDQLGHNRVTLRCDSEAGGWGMGEGNRKSSPRGSQTVPERPPVGEGQSNGIIERAAGLVAGQARTLKAAPGERTTHRCRNSERRSCTCHASKRRKVGTATPILECLLAC